LGDSEGGELMASIAVVVDRQIIIIRQIQKRGTEEAESRIFRRRVEWLMRLLNETAVSIGLRFEVEVDAIKVNVGRCVAIVHSASSSRRR
jgi:hypothetical protein